MSGYCNTAILTRWGIWTFELFWNFIEKGVKGCCAARVLDELNHKQPWDDFNDIHIGACHTMTSLYGNKFTPALWEKRKLWDALHCAADQQSGAVSRHLSPTNCCKVPSYHPPLLAAESCLLRLWLKRKLEWQQLRKQLMYHLEAQWESVSLWLSLNKIFSWSIVICQ